jgi:hypothetical protein
MFIHLLATLAIGAIAAGAVYLFSKPFGWKPPSVAYLVAAAAGILGYSIYDEYSWFTRASSALPNRLQIVRTYATSMPYQPWTYAVPRIYRFDAIDLASQRSNPNAPELALVRILRVTRNTSSENISAILDCPKARYTEIDSTTEFADTGLPLNADWQSLDDHPALKEAVCK